MSFRFSIKSFSFCLTLKSSLSFYSLDLCICVVTNFSITSFVIVFSLWVLQYHKSSCHLKCHLAYLSYFSQNPNIKSILHDGTTFMSSEFHLSIVYVAHTSFLFVTNFMCLYVATFSFTCFVILVCKYKPSSKCGCIFLYVTATNLVSLLTIMSF